MLRLAVPEREGNSVCNEVDPKASRFACVGKQEKRDTNWL